MAPWQEHGGGGGENAKGVSSSLPGISSRFISKNSVIVKDGPVHSDVRPR